MAQGAGKKIVLSPHADGSTGWIDLLKGANIMMTGIMIMMLTITKVTKNC